MNKISRISAPRAKPGKPRRKRAAAGYARGHETRARIVNVAINAFGEAGLEQVSTRVIADKAEVNLGALTYYFGNKDGLYRACAEHIADTVEAQAKPMWDRLEQALEDQTLSRADLLVLLRGLFEMGSEDAVDRKSPPGWMLFMARETAQPGAAAKILYERLTRPSIRLIASLIARITGRAADSADVMIRAISMIGHLVVFRRMRRLMLYELGWANFAEGRNDQVKSVIWDQIAAGLTVEGA